MGDDIICETEWLQLRSVYLDEYDVEFVYTHSPKTDGESVAVLPFRHGSNGVEFLLRREVVPPWDTERKMLCSVTGGHDQPTPEDTAIKELREETGYVASELDMIFLGTCRSSKSKDTIYHLYALDVRDLDRIDPPGDGTSLEEVADCVWRKTVDVIACDDPLLHVMYNRLTSISLDVDGENT